MDANRTPPDGQHEYTVGEAASLHGLTVRTLHHWEQRGLLNPAHDEFNGYRYYTDTDLERITVIMGYRATGMSLDAIRNILQDRANSTEHLLAQRDMLQRKIAAYGRMLETIEHLLEDTMAPKNEQLSAAEKAEIMGEGFSLAHQQEAQKRYGKTDDWAEYQRRTATMNRADWQNGKQQVEEVEHALVEACSRAARRRTHSLSGTAPPCSSLRSPPPSTRFWLAATLRMPVSRRTTRSSRPGLRSGCGRSSLRTLVRTVLTRRKLLGGRLPR